MRIRFKTDMKSLTIPEVVRPMSIEEVVKELETLGLTEENEEGVPTITWEEATKITRRMVDKARKKQTQPEVQEYAEAIGIEKNMNKNNMAIRRMVSSRRNKTNICQKESRSNGCQTSRWRSIADEGYHGR